MSSNAQELLELVKKGDIISVQAFFENLFDPIKMEVLNEVDSTGKTALMLAAYEGKIEIVQAILDSLSNEQKIKALNKTDLEGNTALTFAIFGSEAKTVRAILASLSSQEERTEILNKMNSFDYTALMLAVQVGDLETIRAILESLSNDKKVEVINKTDPSGYTALMFAVVIGKTEIVSAILDSFSDERKIEVLNKADVNGVTALLFAIYKQDSEMVRILMSHGAKFETPDPYKIIKEMGHLLGLSTSIPIKLGDKEISVKTEVSKTLESFLLLDEVVKKYWGKLEPNTEQFKHFEIISNAIEKTKEHLKFSGEVTAKTLCDRFKDDQYTIIPGGWIEHDISVVLYKDYLVVVNRGAREERDVSKERTLIYKIPDKNSITPEFIENLNPKDVRASKEIIMEHINQNIRQMVSEDMVKFELFAELPTKDQKHGTCSFVNPKGSVEAILFFEKFEELVKLPGYLEDDAIKDAKKYAREEYKKFTNDIRNQGIDRLIKFRNQAYSENNEENKKIAIQLAAAIVTEHHGEEKYSDDQQQLPRKVKIAQELKREFDLLAGFSTEDQKRIIQDVRSQSESIDLLSPALRSKRADRDELINLLLVCGVNIDGQHLSAAALHDRPEETVQALLMAFSDTQRKIEAISNALWSAIFNDDSKGVKILLAALSDAEKINVIQSQAENGETALNWAAFHGKTEIVQEILKSLSDEQKIKILNKSVVEGISLLLMAAYRRDEEMVRILENHGAKFETPEPYKMIKGMGHLLGLSTSISIDIDAQKISVKTDDTGTSLESFVLLDSIVKKYLEKISPGTEQLKQFEIISEAIGKTKEYLKFNEQVTAEALCDRFKDNKHTIIPAGWLGHDISIVLYKDYLVVVNRGEREDGDESKERTLIYKIPDKNSITPDFIKNLNPKGDRPSKEMIMGHIRNILGVGLNDEMPAPFSVLPTKDQKHSTCSFVNPKGGVEAILFLDKFEELVKLPGYVEDDAIEDAKKYAREEYKKFTNDIRNQGIDRLIEFRNQAYFENNEENKKIAIQLAVAVIREHHGEIKYFFNGKNLRQTKIGQELKRESDLLAAFSDEEQKHIIQDLQSKPPFVDLLSPALRSKRADRDELINLLLARGVRVNIKHLRLAAKNGHLETVQAILMAFPDTEKRIETIDEVLRLIDSDDNGYKTVQVLLAASGEEKVSVLNKTNLKGNTALMSAVMSGAKEIVQAILESLSGKEKVAMLNKMNLDGNTALMLAVMNGETEIVRIILEALSVEEKMEVLNKTDSNGNTVLNKTDPDGNTVLMFAVASGSTETVQALLESLSDAQKN